MILRIQKLKSHGASPGDQALLDRKIRISRRDNFSHREGNVSEEVKGRGTDSSLETGSRRSRESHLISRQKLRAVLCFTFTSRFQSYRASGSKEGRLEPSWNSVFTVRRDERNERD